MKDGLSPISHLRTLLVAVLLITGLCPSDAVGASLLKLRRYLEAMFDSTPAPAKGLDKSTSIAIGAILFFRREEQWSGTLFRMSDFYPELFRSVVVSPENRQKLTYSQWVRRFDVRAGIIRLAAALALTDQQKAGLNAAAKKCRSECEETIRSFTDGRKKASAEDLWEEGKRKVNAILTNEQKAKLDAKIAQWKKKYDK